MGQREETSGEEAVVGPDLLLSRPGFLSELILSSGGHAAMLQVQKRDLAKCQARAGGDGPFVPRVLTAVLLPYSHHHLRPRGGGALPQEPGQELQGA